MSDRTTLLCRIPLPNHIASNALGLYQLHLKRISWVDIRMSLVENIFQLQAQIPILQLVGLYDLLPSVCQVCEILQISLELELLLPVVENNYQMTSDSITCMYCLLGFAQILLAIDDQHQPLHHYYKLLRHSVLHRYSHSYGFSHLNFSLAIKTTASRSSVEKPESDSRHLYTGHHLHGLQSYL
jgi:hypothetical protein